MAETVEVVEYKNFKIFYRERTNEWHIYNPSGDDMGKKESLSDAKLFIDAAISKDFKRIPFREISDEDIRKGEVTSVTADGDIWVKYSDGSRQKKWSLVIFSECAENEPIFKEIGDIQIQIKGLIQRKEKLEKKLNKAVVPDARR